jgi:hypothetical protein
MTSEPGPSLEAFLNETREQPDSSAPFANESARMLRIDVDGEDRRRSGLGSRALRKVASLLAG